MAFFKGSFYETVPLFAPSDMKKTVFDGVRARPLDRPEPVLEHSVALKERLDSVAHHFYSGPESHTVQDMNWRVGGHQGPAYGNRQGNI